MAEVGDAVRGVPTVLGASAGGRGRRHEDRGNGHETVESLHSKAAQLQRGHVQGGRGRIREGLCEDVRQGRGVVGGGDGELQGGGSPRLGGQVDDHRHVGPVLVIPPVLQVPAHRGSSEEGRIHSEGGHQVWEMRGDRTPVDGRSQLDREDGELLDLVSSAKGVFQNLAEKHFPALDRSKLSLLINGESKIKSSLLFLPLRGIAESTLEVPGGKWNRFWKTTTV